MKKALILFAAMLFAAAGLYAGGGQEDALAKYRNQVTLTGTLQFADGFPVISADGKTYNLFAPHLMREAYSLKPGMPLMVEGEIVQQGPMWGNAAENQQNRESIYVRRVTIDGKTYETDRFAGQDYRGWGYHSGRGGRGGFCGEGFRWNDDHRGRGQGWRDR